MFPRTSQMLTRVNPAFLQGILAAVAVGLFIAAWSWDLRIGVAVSLAAIFWAIRQPASGFPREATTTTSSSPPEKTTNPALASASAATTTGPTRGPATEMSLSQQMLGQHRYALLVRSKIVDTLDDNTQDQATRLLWDRMGLVPEGDVRAATMFDRGEVPPNVWVNPVLLDRHCVSNHEYYEFVAAGGYQQPALWDEEIVSGLLDFVDTTAAPGPRFWVDGTYSPKLASHPVVGISWYEAAAYARWVGKRLPCDAEWVKASSWPVATGQGTMAQRKYPWGNTMDRNRANLWGSGPRATVSVGDYASGVSVGGLYQLVGNVWEWTSTPFKTTTNRRRPDDPDPVGGEVPLQSIRGAAFDTYFDAQATCQFQSGEKVLSRKHNVGFRCALNVCDVADFFSTGTTSEAEELEEATT